MSRKLVAWVMALLVIAFPFRRAFLSDEAPGIMMMLSFLITVAGIFLFYYLTMNRDAKSHH